MVVKVVKPISVLPVLVCLLMLTGCPSYMTYHSTRTAPKGKVEATVGVGYSLWGQSVFTLLKSEVTGIARVGLSDSWDVGLRARSDWVLGAETKFRILEGERLHMAIAPGVSFSVLAPLLNGLSRLAERFLDMEDLVSVVAYEAHLPLLFGLKWNENIFVFGPKLAFTNWNIRALAEHDGPLGGSSIGQVLVLPGVVLALDWTLNGGVRVMPEINVHVDRHGSFQVQAGLGTFF